MIHFLKKTLGQDSNAIGDILERDWGRTRTLLGIHYCDIGDEKRQQWKD